MTEFASLKERVESDLMDLTIAQSAALSCLSSSGHSALMLGRKIGLSRPDASRMLQSLRRASLVKYDGGWIITQAGRSALLSAIATQDRSNSDAET